MDYTDTTYGYQPTEEDYADYMEHLQKVAQEEETLLLISCDPQAWMLDQVNTWVAMKKEGKLAEAQTFLDEVNRLEALYYASLPEYEEVYEDEADFYRDAVEADADVLAMAGYGESW